MAQGGLPEIEEDPFVVTAYVDPDHGNDATAVINDPDKPFKKLQAAIDTAHATLATFAATNPVTATVIAMEGVYGPTVAPSGVGCSPLSWHNGPYASGDSLPIVMRDRVHVKGIGARRCILRGTRCGDVNTSGSSDVFWPSSNFVTGSPWERSSNSEVLLDLSQTNVVHSPWFAEVGYENDAVEVFQGFTFQSGDVQVLATSGYDLNHLGEPKCVVANCIFDMRDGFTVPVEAGEQPEFPRRIYGPTFGVLMLQRFVSFSTGSGLSGGYVDQPVLIAQNTFIMAQFNGTAWVNGSLPNAVAIMNATDPGCGTGGAIDCDRDIMGLANCGVAGNLIRSAPSAGVGSPTFFPAAMIGIGSDDTKATGNATSFNETNAMNAELAGINSGSVRNVPWTGPQIGFTAFFSTPVQRVLVPQSAHPVDLYHPCGASAVGLAPGSPCSTVCGTTCNPTATTVPLAGARIFTSNPTALNPGDDPRFVGEYLVAAHSAIVGSQYVDWRLLPNSPVTSTTQLAVNVNRTMTAENGSAWDFRKYRENDPYVWDGEGYGNRRRSGALIDPGFDEVEWFLMAGTYANDSNSHYEKGILNRSAGTGQPVRFIVSQLSIGSSLSMTNDDEIKVYHVSVPATNPPKPASYQPIGTLPTSTQGPGTLNAFFDRKYISFPPTPRWSFTFNSTVHTDNYRPLFLPVTLAHTQFALFMDSSTVDNECSTGTCTEHWFATQFVLSQDVSGVPTDRIWSNIQAEYR